MGGGEGAAEERHRLKETLEVLRSRMKLQGIIDVSVRDATCCISCGMQVRQVGWQLDRPCGRHIRHCGMD